MKNMIYTYAYIFMDFKSQSLGLVHLLSPFHILKNHEFLFCPIFFAIVDHNILHCYQLTASSLYVCTHTHISHTHTLQEN
jgi:hypothetical protein